MTRIAIIGGGISGLTAAHLLSPQAEVTLFESESRLGGHTHTVSTTGQDGRAHAIDTGFIVFNDRTYPLFNRLLESIGVGRQPTRMGFSLRCDDTGVEYAGTNLNTLFAQRRNLVSPAFLRMVRDILRFNRASRALLSAGAIDPTLTLGEYLRQGRYSQRFRDHYIVPMGAAIWSSGSIAMDAFPAGFFLRFFENHGLLTVDDQPQWYVVPGGSASYLEPLTRRFAQRVRLSSPVASVCRTTSQVDVNLKSGEQLQFDQVVMACHADQALELLADPTDSERQVLSALPYHPNEAVLHTDRSQLPRNRRTWSSWNYHLPQDANSTSARLTYNMNILQGLDASETFCVSLNPADSIDPDRVIQRIAYRHPVFTPEGIAAQARWHEISNHQGRTWYCGAYWHNGFHEDGVRSASRVAEQLGGRL